MPSKYLGKSSGGYVALYKTGENDVLAEQSTSLLHKLYHLRATI